MARTKPNPAAKSVASQEPSETILIVVCVLAVQAKTGERMARMATLLFALTLMQTLVGDPSTRST